MNRLAIEWNNQGVDFMRQGQVFKAFEFFSQAFDLTREAEAVEKMFPSGSRRSSLPVAASYSYQWVDCQSNFQSGLPVKLRDTLTVHHEGCLPFLFAKFLKVFPQLTSHEFGSNIHSGTGLTDNTQLPQHGFAWVICFNLAIACSIYGTCLGERGYQLAQRADQLFQKVQIRIEDELPSKHWSILQLAILNHQICIAHEYNNLEDKMCHIDYTYDTIASSLYLDDKDWEFFSMAVELLGETPTAVAA